MSAGKLLAMACLLGAASAQAGEWQHYAETPDGTTWAWRTGTGMRETVQGRVMRTLVVMRTAGSATWMYKAAAEDGTCQRRRGDVHLLTLTGHLAETTAVRHDDGSVGAQLLRVLCTNTPEARS